MLSELSIRNIVLIEQLDIQFHEGLSVLTGETGAGKSILLDGLSLALGGRGDGGLVQKGTKQGTVTAVFELDALHPAHALIESHDLPREDWLVVKRTQTSDGRTRAFVNDVPVSASVLKTIGRSLVEIHGQHDDRAMLDPATHRRLGGCIRRTSGAGAGRYASLGTLAPVRSGFDFLAGAGRSCAQ